MQGLGGVDEYQETFAGLLELLLQIGKKAGM